MNTPNLTTPNIHPLPGYTLYPAEEDIYARAEQVPYTEESENAALKYGYPDLPARIEASGWDDEDADEDEDDEDWNEKDYDDELTGDDLDIPGGELDDDMEEIGEEDEENNYYSVSDNEDEDDDED